MILNKLILILNVCFICNMITAQTTLSFEQKERIKNNFINNITLKQIFFMSRFLKQNQKDKILNYKYALEFPGFGYQPLSPNCEIKKVDLEYPDTSWVLYQVSFPDDLNNITLKEFNNGNFFISNNNKILIGFNNHNEIKYISGGNGFVHSIAKDFDLNPQDPNSYLLFYKFKHFPANYDSFVYTRTENGLFVYTSTKKVQSSEKLIYTFEDKVEGLLIQKREHFIDPQNPEKRIQSKALTPDAFYYKKINQYPTDGLIDLDSFKIKQRHLLDALMRNIYLYKIHENYSQVEEILEIDTSNWTINCPSSALDIIPDYDETILPFQLVKQVTCGKYLIKEKQPRLIDYICEDEKNCDVIIGKTVMSPRMELYGFVRRPITTLLSTNKVTKKAEFRTDYNFTDNSKNLERETNVLPPPIPSKYSFEYGGRRYCPQRPPNVNEIIGEDVLYYLIGIDTISEKIYFISGGDIFLSKASELYGYRNFSGWKQGPLIHENIADWDYETKLAYMQDRAYLYQVEYLKPEHVVYEDKHKIVVEGKGYFYQKKIKVKMTLHYDDQENVIIEII